MLVLKSTQDIFRFGGMYADQDVLFVKELPKEHPNFFISEGNNNFLTSAVMKLEKAHPIMEVILKRLVSLRSVFNRTI